MKKKTSSHEAKIPYKTKWELLYHKQKPKQNIKFIYMLWSPIPAPPPTSSAPSHLPTSSASPLSHALQLPIFPTNYQFHSHNPSLPRHLPLPEWKYH